MFDVKYVVRFFKDDTYLYSIHCTSDVLDELLAKAKNDGQNVKVLAYKSESEVE